LKEFIEAVFVGIAMESILGDKEVSSGQTRVTAQQTITIDPLLDLAQMFTGVYEGCFPWSSYGIDTR
jgi:hypothetical protein